MSFDMQILLFSITMIVWAILTTALVIRQEKSGRHRAGSRGVGG